MFVGFHEPSAWWLLLLTPFLVLLHLLKMRRETVVVPSLMLWQDAPEDTRATAPFRRFRINRLLILQLAAFLCAVVALARPYLPGPASAEGRVVLVFDTSLSMQATDVEPSRFEAGRREARDLLHQLRRGTRVAIVVAGPPPQIASPFSPDRATHAERRGQRP